MRFLPVVALEPGMLLGRDIVSQKDSIGHIRDEAAGTGYPFGRDASQIPLMAKILHGVDVYDALTSKRPYKEPYSPADAFEYLIGGKDILFNGTLR